jgi:hypothetical protein
MAPITFELQVIVRWGAIRIIELALDLSVSSPLPREIWIDREIDLDISQLVIPQHRAARARGERLPNHIRG